MEEMNILMSRLRNLKKLRSELEHNLELNSKYIESINWATKICEKEVSRKIATKNKYRI